MFGIYVLAVCAVRLFVLVIIYSLKDAANSSANFEERNHCSGSDGLALRHLSPAR